MADSRTTRPRGPLQLRTRRAAACKPTSSPPRVLRSPGAHRRCQVCRGCRLSSLCLLTATRRPRPCGQRSHGMRAMDRGRAGAPLHCERFGPCQKSIACSRPACELQPRVGFSGAAPRLFAPAAPAQRAEHRSELAVEPSFFTPHARRGLADRVPHGVPRTAPRLYVRGRAVRRRRAARHAERGRPLPMG